jgi:integrase
MGKKRGAGEGSIYQRADGMWVASVHVGYKDGKRKRKYLYGKTRGKVKEKLTKTLHDQQIGMPISYERQTVGQYLSYWLDESVKSTRRSTTYRSYEQNVRLHLNPQLGRVQLQELTPQHVQALMNDKLEGGLAPRTVAIMHETLRCALNQAMKWGLVPRNVADLVTPPRVHRDGIVPLSTEEAGSLLEAAKGHRLEVMFSVAVAVGLRLGEIRGLRWSDIDFESRTLYVRNQLQYVDKQWTFVEPKSRQSRRAIILPQFALIALRGHRTRQLEEQLAAGPAWQGWDLVFCSNVGGPLDDSNARRVLRKLIAKAGLRHFRFHDLRHTCASFLLAQNAHPRVIMEILGHSQISLTMDTYSHVMPSLKSDAADEMDRVLGALGG